MKKKWKKFLTSLRKSAGFATAGITAFVLNYYFGLKYNTLIMAFMYMTALFTVEYMHSNPIKITHIFTLFFWIAYVFNFSGYNKGGELMPIIHSILLASIVSILPLIVNYRFKIKDGKLRPLD